MSFTLGACATIPHGPSVMVLPPAGKPFEVFQAEDYHCRQWAASQTQLTAGDTYNRDLANSAVLGTLIGAGLGAAIGSASGNVGAGAGIGAASGLFVGTASGADAAHMSGREVQRRYDIAYQQCMHAKGNIIPGVTYQSRQSGYYPPPPPPAGYSGSGTSAAPPAGVYPTPPPQP